MSDHQYGEGNGFANLNPNKPSNVESVRESVANGPAAQATRDEANKTAQEFSNLAAARKTPPQTTATNQSLTHYHSYFFELLSWNNPRASAIAYAGIISMIFAARYLDILRWGLKLIWMALGTTVLAEVAGQALLNKGIASQFRPRKYYKVSRETLETMIGDVHELINFFVIEAQRILFAENITASAAAFVSAFVSYYLVKIVPYWGLAVIGTTVAFIVPLAYTSNQELIDNQIRHASELMGAQTAQLRDAASKHTSDITSMTKQYMGDYSAKAQSMLRGRSASPEAARAHGQQDGAADMKHIPEIKEEDFPPAPSGIFAAPPAPVEQDGFADGPHITHQAPIGEQKPLIPA